jgi:hypothetical protein
MNRLTFSTMQGTAVNRNAKNASDLHKEIVGNGQNLIQRTLPFMKELSSVWLWELTCS